MTLLYKVDDLMLCSSQNMNEYAYIDVFHI